MNIEQITINNFKVLKQVSFRPGKVNVLIGSNGSGKSTVLEAVGLLSAAMTDRVDDNSLSRKGIRLSAPNLYKSSFRDGGRKAPTIELGMLWYDESEKSRNSCFSYSVNLNTPSDNGAWRYHSEALIFQDKKWGRSGASKASFNPHVGMLMIDQDPVLQSIYCSVKGLKEYAIYQPNTPVLRNLIPDTTQMNPLGLAGGRLAEAIDELLCIDSEGNPMIGNIECETIYELIDWAEYIGISSPSKSTLNAAVPTSRRIIEFQDRFMRSGERFTGYDASEGALYVLFLICLVMHPKTPEIFAIDSFDHAMHPRLARATTKLLCDLALQSNKTIFITTHNPLVLDGLNLGNDAIRLFTVERSHKSGCASVQRIEIDPNMLESGQPLSRLWINGRLGGVPNLL